MRMNKNKRSFMTSAVLVGFCAISTSALAKTDLTLWSEGAGNPGEIKVLKEVVKDFNASQEKWNINLVAFPQDSYNDSVAAAALAEDLPDILTVDGPVMPNWAWSGYLQPLPIDPSLVKDFLPGVKGYWGGKLYSIGLWDAAVSMVTRKSTLTKAGIRIPTLEKPWTKDEFESVLQKLKATGKYEYPLDLGMAWKNEWYPYAFSPFLQSFGGDLIDRSNYQVADGVLNGEDAIAFGKWWQGLFTKGYVPGTSQDPADRETGLIDGKYAMQWNGNWAALGVLKEFGSDTLFLPAPDFGHGPIIGAASWQMAVSSKSKYPEGAADFIKFAMQDVYLAAFSDATGFIPPTKSAADLTGNYNEGGLMAGFYDLAAAQGRVRPVTPGYVVEAKVFLKALSDMANGADVVDTLDNAADEIDADIKKNRGYGHK